MGNFGEGRLFCRRSFIKVGVSAYLREFFSDKSAFAKILPSPSRLLNTRSNEKQFNFSAQIPCNSKENLKANTLEYHLVNAFVTYP